MNQTNSEMPISSFTLNELITMAGGEKRPGIMGECIAANSASEMEIFRFPSRLNALIIGVGTEGTAPYPAVDIYGQPTGDVVMAKVEIDEKTLGAMADLTGGKYFRATDNAKLKAIYDEINQLEKSKVEVTERISYHERFLVWALAALGALLLEFLLSNLVLKRIP